MDASKGTTAYRCFYPLVTMWRVIHTYPRKVHCVHVLLYVVVIKTCPMVQVRVLWYKWDMSYNKWDMSYGTSETCPMVQVGHVL